MEPELHLLRPLVSLTHYTSFCLPYPGLFFVARIWCMALSHRCSTAAALQMSSDSHDWAYMQTQQPRMEPHPAASRVLRSRRHCCRRSHTHLQITTVKASGSDYAQQSRCACLIRDASAVSAWALHRTLGFVWDALRCGMRSNAVGLVQA